MSTSIRLPVLIVTLRSSLGTYFIAFSQSHPNSVKKLQFIDSVGLKLSEYTSLDG